MSLASRICVPSNIFLTIWRNQRDYHLGLGLSKSEAGRLATQCVSSSFVSNDGLSAIDIQKDHDEEAQGDWTR